jgi:hypothetical protein
MHLEWHTERRWSLLPPSAIAYAERQGWRQAERQEGDPGNGVEFLSMHRAMLNILVEHDASSTTYVVGWQAPPTDPRDAGGRPWPRRREGIRAGVCVGT